MSHHRPEPPSRPAWYQTRPLVGAILVILAGLEILAVVKAPLPVVLHVGMQGVAGYLVPMVILLCGVLLLVNPQQKTFYAIVAALLTLASWLTSNLGGFILGMVLGLLGSAFAFAWSPNKKRRPKTPSPAQDRHDPLPAGGADGDQAPTGSFLGEQFGERRDDAPARGGEGVPGGQG
jgi:uncharacterized protein DUF6114